MGGTNELLVEQCDLLELCRWKRNAHCSSEFFQSCDGESGVVVIEGHPGFDELIGFFNGPVTPPAEPSIWIETLRSPNASPDN